MARGILGIMLRLIAPLAAALASIYAGGPQKANPNGLSGSDRASIRAEYERHRRTAFPVAGGHRARNYGQQWVTRFDGRGFDVTPDAAGWRWGLELLSYGFPGQELSVKHARASADVEKLAYQWDSTIKEWFVNGSSGLEHGFTLASRPGSNSAPGALTLHLAVRGTLTPHVSSDGLWVSFMDHGVAALNYAGLKVTDAEGRKLAARFTQESRGLRLDVEERGARYPITIDPVAQQAYLKPNAVGNTQAGDLFGFAVSVSGDTVVVGARDEDSSSLGVNSTPNELAAGSSGAAYVFVRSAGQWSQQAYLKPASVGPGGQAGDHFGWSVAISGDTVVVGAPDEDSNTFGVNSTPVEGATNSGAAYVFIRIGGVWSQQAYLKQGAAGMPRASDEFGYSVAISGDTLVVGSYDDPSSTTGINSAPNTLAPGAGGAYVFARFGGVWSQQAYLKPAAVGTTQANDHFGNSVAVSGDTVVVGAFQEDSSSTGINSTPNDAVGAAGAAYVFARFGGVWVQQAYLKPAAVGTSQAGDTFGNSVAVSEDTVVVGAPGEASSTTGVNTTPNEGAGSSGAVYVFTRFGGVWSQQAYVKPTGVGTTQNGDSFGSSVALSGDTLVVGAPGEDSSTLGVNTTPNELASLSGAAYVFTRSAGVWSQHSYLKPAAVGTTQLNDSFGWSVAVSGDTLVVGAPNEDSSSLGVNSTPNEGATEAGAAYTFVITVIPPVSPALVFVPVNPCRVVDTRLSFGTFGGPSIAGLTQRDFPIPLGSCAIPSNAAAFSLNVTVVPATTLGYLTIFPTGAAQPLVSTLNSVDGRIKANAAIVPAGTNGSVSVFVTNQTDVILDVNGYFVPVGAPNGLSFYPVNPCRVVDTRLANAPLGGPTMQGQATRDFPVPSSACGIPSSARAYSLNMTVVPTTILGYLTTWPSGGAQPFVSTLNDLTGTIVANAAIVPAGASGSVSVFVTNVTTLIIDINGYFAPPGNPGALSFYTVNPCRVVDTRLANGPLGGPVLSAGSSRDFPIPNASCGLPGTAQAYSMNATVVPPGFLGFLSLWPSGQSQPFVSTLNATDGAITANAAIVPAGVNGAVSAYVSHQSQLILDVNGYFAP